MHKKARFAFKFVKLLNQKNFFSTKNIHNKYQGLDDGYKK